MPSSIVTAVPSGLIKEWCIQPQFFGFDQDPLTCGNSTSGTEDSDFETICCDGDIIDTKQDLYQVDPSNAIRDLRLSDLVCCRLQGPQTGGLLPIPSGPSTTCVSGTPTPLASLAATNISNAAAFYVTYTSASYGGATPGDFIPSQRPTCLWADTAHRVAMTSVTVAAADITTFPTTDPLGGTITDGYSFETPDSTFSGFFPPGYSEGTESLSELTTTASSSSSLSSPSNEVTATASGQTTGGNPSVSRSPGPTSSSSGTASAQPLSLRSVLLTGLVISAFACGL
ncbi:MAG: hypothetical protein M1820_010206 [Bogoriella megaspora]|nr:MAG: hypothetical protein M1820_010206 [Bogoriella megaspora]